MTTVLEATVKNNLCVGCGVCAGICPQDNLTMQWNSYGEYNPVKLQECDHECGLCMNVCPSLTMEKSNEDVIARELYGGIPEIKHCRETGYYLTCGVGGVRDPERRAACASGGLASWFLEQLLTEHIVDEVICVKHSSCGTKLFEYFVAKSVEDVKDSRGSAYYPNELSEMIVYMLKHDKKYGVIGLPCNIKAIRLAQKRSKILQKRIVIIAGLTCGRMKSSLFTDYTAYLSGLKGKPVYVQYKNTDLSRPPNSHRYKFYNSKREKTQISEKIGSIIFSSGIFGLTACRFCDDMFAECADITFMDAWLPEYTKTEPRGTSIFVSRSELCSELFRRGKKTGELVIDELPIQKVIASQGGLIRRKKIQYMSQIHKKNGLTPPEKRFTNQNMKLNWIERYQARRYVYLDYESRRKWMQSNANLKKFHEWVEMQWLLSLPVRVIIIGFNVFKNRILNPMKK